MCTMHWLVPIQALSKPDIFWATLGSGNSEISLVECIPYLACIINQVERNVEVHLTSLVSVELTLSNPSELSYISETQLFLNLIYIMDEM